MICSVFQMEQSPSAPPMAIFDPSRLNAIARQFACWACACTDMQCSRVGILRIYFFLRKKSSYSKTEMQTLEVGEFLPERVGYLFHQEGKEIILSEIKLQFLKTYLKTSSFPFSVVTKMYSPQGWKAGSLTCTLNSWTWTWMDFKENDKMSYFDRRIGPCVDQGKLIIFISKDQIFSTGGPIHIQVWTCNYDSLKTKEKYIWDRLCKGNYLGISPTRSDIISEEVKISEIDTSFHSYLLTRQSSYHFRIKYKCKQQPFVTTLVWVLGCRTSQMQTLLSVLAEANWFGSFLWNET